MTVLLLPQFGEHQRRNTTLAMMPSLGILPLLAMVDFLFCAQEAIRAIWTTGKDPQPRDPQPGDPGFDRILSCEKGFPTPRPKQQQPKDKTQYLQRSHPDDTTRRLRYLRLLGGLMLLYPLCLMTTSCYAQSHGLMEVRPSSVSSLDLQHVTPEHHISSSLERQTNLPTTLPEAILNPSLVAFVAACLLWTVLEWAHYQSNTNDRYQKHILISFVALSVSPSILCGASWLGTVVNTVPWAVHFGLVISDVIHIVA